jgi:hypothetical protein
MAIVHARLRYGLLTKSDSNFKEFDADLGSYVGTPDGKLYKFVQFDDSAAVGSAQNDPVGYVAGNETGQQVTTDISRSAANLLAGSVNASTALVDNDYFFMQVSGPGSLNQASAAINAGDAVRWSGDQVVIVDAAATAVHTVPVLTSETTTSAAVFLRGLM